MKGRLAATRPLVSDSSFRNVFPPVCPSCFRLRRGSSTRPAASQFYPARRRHQSTWAQTVSAAQHVLNGRAKTDSSFAGVSVDPLRIVAKELKFLTRNIQKLLGSGHPMLQTVAHYYTHSEGKNIRPLLVLLMSRATALSPKVPRHPSVPTSSTINDPISPSEVLADVNPSEPAINSLSTSSTDTPYSLADSAILPSQQRLAEITELIHTASLLHDDVIDNSVSRRSSPSANIAFGNKLAVLAGDFLLGRASVALARLRDPEVIELLATVIANLVEGEFMQLKNTATDETAPVWTEETLSYYLQKTYLKSASLISKSCRATALLGQNTPEVVDAAYSYGRNLGLAFQLVDDMLDYTTSSQTLGKPAGADLELGLATAPLLFAWKDNRQLGVLVGRKFAANGDVAMARDLVARSSGLEQTRALAQEYADKAAEAIGKFPESKAKEGLLEMCVKTLKRRK
ncbi:coq1 putative hexaprenyl diphosphate synthase [Puttea exsequens]|nr:coq1 putative hexaprenyl diphosphate synthase [Puttea exsequens]